MESISHIRTLSLQTTEVGSTVIPTRDSCDLITPNTNQAEKATHLALFVARKGNKLDQGH